MSKKTNELLERAKELNNPALEDAIEAVEYLDLEEENGATANHQEYKNLKELVGKVERGEVVVPEESQQQKQEPAKSKAKSKEPTPKKGLRYVGIKMIGSMYYSAKDGYKKGFASADDCANHFNKE